MRTAVHIDDAPRVHVLVKDRDVLWRLKNLKRKIVGVVYSLVMTMTGRVQLHVWRRFFRFPGGPGLQREGTPFHHTRLGSTARINSSALRRIGKCAACRT